RGNDLDCIKIGWRQFYAFLDDDGNHWDYANIQSDDNATDFENPWLDESERQERRTLNHQIHDFWDNEIPEEYRATFHVNAFIKYDSIIEIDERGDNEATFPHVYVPFKNRSPVLSRVEGELIVPGFRTGPDGKMISVQPRKCRNPELENRVERFPA